MKKILIIGAKGMLGQQLAKVFSEDKNYHVIGWGREEIDIVKFDQAREKILQVAPEIIINAAAYNNVDGCEKNEELANLINGYAAGNLAQIAKEAGALIIHYGSGYVFDGERGNYQENAEPRPISKYGHSKYLGEKELRSKADKFYLIRVNLLFGPPALSKNAKKSFVDLIFDLAKERDTFKFIADEISNPTYVLDLARATKKLIEENYPFGVYHLVNEGRASWYDWAQKIFLLAGLKKKVKPIKSDEYSRPAKRPKNSVLINTKFPKLRSWQESLSEYLRKR